MKLTHEDYDQVSVMTVRGDLTADEVDKLRKASLERMENNVRDFVLDISNMEFVDSKGLETLLWLQEVAGENLGQVRFVSPTENVNKIFKMTRLASRFDRHDNVETAIKSLR